MEELMLDDDEDEGGERDVGEEDLGPDDYADTRNDPDQKVDEPEQPDVLHHYKEYENEYVLEAK